MTGLLQPYRKIIEHTAKHIDPILARHKATLAIATTNAIESVNSVIRKFTRNRKIYPNEESALKITFMAIREAAKKWTMPIRNWKAALNHFAILFEDRLPMQLP